MALLISALIGYATWAKVRSAHAAHDGSGRDVFLAGGGLSWLFVAGSITLTNLSTEQLVGNNGNQMLLLAWWELAGFIGLLILAFVFVPIYYRHGCTTVTELLDRRYQGGSVRTLVAGIFLVGSVLIYIPAALYSGSLFLKSMFAVDWPLWYFAAPMAVIAAPHHSYGFPTCRPAMQVEDCPHLQPSKAPAGRPDCRDRNALPASRPPAGDPADQ